MAGVHAALDTDSLSPTADPHSFSFMLAQQAVPINTVQYLTETIPPVQTHTLSATASTLHSDANTVSLTHKPTPLHDVSVNEAPLSLRQSDRWVVTHCTPKTCPDSTELCEEKGFRSSPVEPVANIEPHSQEAAPSDQCPHATQATDTWHEHEPSRRQSTAVSPVQVSDTRCPTATGSTDINTPRHNDPPQAVRNDFDDPEADNFMNDDSYMPDRTAAPDYAFDLPPCHLVTEDDHVNTCAPPVVITITADLFPTPTTDHVPLLASNSTPRISATAVPHFASPAVDIAPIAATNQTGGDRRSDDSHWDDTFDSIAATDKSHRAAGLWAVDLYYFTFTSLLLHH